MTTTTTSKAIKAKEKPNTRKLAFRQQAMNELLESKGDITFALAFEVAKLDCEQCRYHDVAHNPKSQNCRDNPYCINRLGLEKFDKLIKTELAKADKAKEEHKKRDLNDQPAGLINSGNFCYVNSFLQVWFNVLEFRQIVYDFRPSIEYKRPEVLKFDVEKVMMCLQDLFYTLETTPFEDTDKNESLISALRLNAEQQDAQEFTLMMFDALDRNLPSHPNGYDIGQRIKNLYSGTMRNRLSCELCASGRNKDERCTSLQLNIAGHTTLSDALDAYFSEERLDDYKCEMCESKNNCVRRFQYHQLPPVVLIQLNRYTYDQKGRRKLKTPLAYPREIPADSFHPDRTMELPAEMYDLFAVMIHEGDSADCGHYYDLVKSPLNGKWYKYDDEKVEAISKLPGTEKPTTAIKENGKKAKSKDKAPTDQKACYGLLYRRRDERLPLPHPTPPPDELVAASKAEMESKFMGQKSEVLAKSEKRFGDVQKRSDKLRSTFAKLETYESNFEKPNEVVFLPVSLIMDILQTEYDVAADLASNKKKDSEAQPSSTNGNNSEANGESEQAACDSVPLVVETAPVESTSDLDIIAIAMTSSELPTVEPAKGMTTRGRNGASRTNYAVFSGKKRSTAQPAVRNPPIASQVALKLDSHTITVCRHGKMPIEPILFGDVKAVARQPAIALLRQYDYKVKIERENGNVDYPSMEKEKDVFVFTADDLCVQCVIDLRNEAKFNIELEEDEKLVKKILKEFKNRMPRSSIYLPGPPHGPSPPPGCYYVAKPALLNYKKSTISEQQHRIQGTINEGGELVYESVSNRLENGFPELAKRGKGRPRKRSNNSDSLGNDDRVNGDAPNKSRRLNSSIVDLEPIEEDENEIVELTKPATRCNGINREFVETELPKNILDDEDEEILIEEDGLKAASQQNEADERDKENSPELGDDLIPEESVEDENTRPSSTSNASTVPASAVEFNSELRCTEHEDGRVQFSQYRAYVTEDEWRQLSRHFAESFAVRCDEKVCELCREADEKAYNDSTNMRQQIRGMRKQLTDTLKEVERRKPGSSNKQLTYGICSVFLDKLKTISQRSSSASAPSICQECLFCEHGLPCRDIYEPEENDQTPMIVPLTEEEWTTFVEEIQKIQKEQKETSAEEIDKAVIPVRLGSAGAVEDMCNACYSANLEAAEQAKYVFDNENIYVRVTSGTSEEDATFAATSAKTTRRVAKKNLYKIKLSSSSKLLDLKVGIYSQTGQTPRDQLLYKESGGDMFDNDQNEKTLFDLRIVPNNSANPLILIAQSANNQSTNEESSEPRAPERGFIDTALAH